MTDLAADAALAADLVREAGTLALRMREEGVRTEQKTSVSDLVTTADRAAERLITDHLFATRPDDGVLGEEGAGRRGSSGRTWVIDPVDGTYNFVHGLEWWCSAIALTDGEDVVLGAIYHPPADVLFLGGPGLATTRNGERLAPLPDRPLGESCMTTYLAPQFLGTEVGVALGRALGGVSTWRNLGSASMDATTIAGGQLEVSCQHSMPDWDRLPGAALIRGAGGDARQVDAAGVRWSVAGAPTAVAEVCTALAAG